MSGEREGWGEDGDGEGRRGNGGRWICWGRGGRCFSGGREGVREGEKDKGDANGGGKWGGWMMPGGQIPS